MLFEKPESQSQLKLPRMENCLLYISFAVVIFVWLYKRLTHDDNFEGQGIAHEKPLPIVGNIWPMLSRKEGIVQLLERLYHKFKSEK